MTAEEARKTAEERIIETDKDSRFDEIMEAITLSAKNGNMIYICDLISIGDKIRLSRLGYNISGYTMSSDVISWE